MKNELLVILTSILLVGCSVGNEPTIRPAKLSRNDISENIYEQSYQAFHSTAIHDILELNDISSLFNLDTEIDLMDAETTYDTIINIVNAYYSDGTLNQILESSLYSNGIICEIDQEHELDAQVMESLLLEIQNSKYITWNYRQRVFEDVNIGLNEKLVISFIYAINNWMYESLHSHTLVVKDEASYYFTMQIPEDIAMSIYFENDQPLNLYEISIVDVSNFELDNLVSYIQNDATSYMVFNSHEERELYLELLDHSYTKQVTRQECDEIYRANIEQVEATVAGTMAGAVICGFYNPPTVGATALGMLVYWAVMVDYYKREHKACIASATS